jgi:hypothetical protein
MHWLVAVTDMLARRVIDFVQPLRPLQIIIAIAIDLDDGSLCH